MRIPLLIGAAAAVLALGGAPALAQNTPSAMGAQPMPERSNQDNFKDTRSKARREADEARAKAKADKAAEAAAKADKKAAAKEKGPDPK